MRPFGPPNTPNLRRGKPTRGLGIGIGPGHSWTFGCQASMQLSLDGTGSAAPGPATGLRRGRAGPRSAPRPLPCCQARTWSLPAPAPLPLLRSAAVSLHVPRIVAWSPPYPFPALGSAPHGLPQRTPGPRDRTGGVGRASAQVPASTAPAHRQQSNGFGGWRRCTAIWPTSRHVRVALLLLMLRVPVHTHPARPVNPPTPPTRTKNTQSP